MGDRASSAADLPARIGRHAVLGHLATGGMSEIFLGRESSGQPVVIKRILPHLARQGSFVAMFLDEARIGALLHHPNVVEIHELGQVGIDLFMVMEYLAGESASGLLRRLVVRDERLAFALAAYIVAEACKGLHAAHELRDDHGNRLGLVHRDVSPQNIFLTYDGGVKVLDFGIATAAHRLSRTATGELKGKFSYMSPEQCRGEPLDVRSDVFSLGIVLYELSMQRRLFSRSNELLVLKAVCEEPITRPSREVPDFPEMLEDICLRALARDKDQRYQTAHAMQRDLEIAVQMLLGTADPRTELARMLGRTFADRVEEKRRMLDEVRSGAELPTLPAVEADEHVVVPQVSQYTKTPVPTAVEAPGMPVTAAPRAHPSRARVGLAAGIAVLAIVAVIAIPRMRDDASQAASAPAPAMPAAVAEPSPPAPAPPAVEPAPPPAPTEVVITIESQPAHATVLVDGVERGKTPVNVTLPVARGTARLQVKSHGYAAAAQELRLDHDQSLFLQLTKKRGSASARDRSSNRSSKGFHRFD